MHRQIGLQGDHARHEKNGNGFKKSFFWGGGNQFVTTVAADSLLSSFISSSVTKSFYFRGKTPKNLIFTIAVFVTFSPFIPRKSANAGQL